jgi:hypothetical protein
MVRADMKGIGSRLRAAGVNLGKYLGSGLDCKSASSDALESCNWLMRGCFSVESLSHAREYRQTIAGRRPGLGTRQALFQRTERYLGHYQRGIRC